MESSEDSNVLMELSSALDLFPNGTVHRVCECVNVREWVSVNVLYYQLISQFLMAFHLPLIDGRMEKESPGLLIDSIASTINASTPPSSSLGLERRNSRVGTPSRARSFSLRGSSEIIRHVRMELDIFKKSEKDRGFYSEFIIPEVTWIAADWLFWISCMWKDLMLAFLL